MADSVVEHPVQYSHYPTTTAASALVEAAAAGGKLSPSFTNDSNQVLNGSSSHSSSSSVHNENGTTLCHGSSSNGHGTPTSNVSFNPQKPPATVDYLTQLLKDKKQLAAFPNIFVHLERLVDDEINRVRVQLFQFEFTHEPMALPDPAGEVIVKQEKVFVPVKEFPEYNFVGRILGPRGMTAKQLEQETGCKIMVRGKGSMRDKKKEEANRGKPNWEHLNEDLHVLIQCEDTANRVDLKILRAVDEVKKLLVPSPEGEDELKKKQLMELAIINGTFRQGSQAAGAKGNAVSAAQASLLGFDQNAARFLGSNAAALGAAQAAIRSPGLAGAPLIMQPNAAAAHRLNQAALLQQLGLQAQPQAAPADYQQLLLSQMGFSQMQYDPNALAQAQLQQQQLAAMLAANGIDYAAIADPSGAAAAAAAGGAMIGDRRFLGQSRVHPYQQAAGKPAKTA